MQSTTNYGLNKPESTDFYDVEHFNANMDKIDEELAKMSSSTTGIDTHINNKNNPHGVTKTQVGLGNADNTSDMDKPISTAMQTALDAKPEYKTLGTGYSVSFSVSSSRAMLVSANAQGVSSVYLVFTKSGGVSFTEISNGLLTSPSISGYTVTINYGSTMTVRCIYI
jgi:hypothetical protein